MVNAIVLIAMIAATRAFFASDAFGCWIFCVEPTIKLILFTASRFAKWPLNGVFLCVFLICQGERRTGCMAAPSLMGERADGFA
jgi:hypothetical protein